MEVYVSLPSYKDPSIATPIYYEASLLVAYDNRNTVLLYFRYACKCRILLQAIIVIDP
jgi:hypothetical protein